jgi:hypothetical protein
MLTTANIIHDTPGSAIAQEQVLQQPLKLTKELIIMTDIVTKKKAGVSVKGLYGGKDAEVLLLTKAVSSNPAAALPIVGSDGKTLDVLALTPATGVTLVVDGYIRDPDGDVREVMGATSNPFDVVDASADMVPVLNADGSPQYETDANGNVVNDAAGNPKQKMVPAEAALSVQVA